MSIHITPDPRELVFTTELCSMIVKIIQTQYPFLVNCLKDVKVNMSWIDPSGWTNTDGSPIDANTAIGIHQKNLALQALISYYKLDDQFEQDVRNWLAKLFTVLQQDRPLFGSENCRLSFSFKPISQSTWTIYPIYVDL